MATRLAALEPASGKRPRHRHRHGIERRVGDRALALPAEIDDRELREIAITLDQVAEIDEFIHYGSREPR